MHLSLKTELYGIFVIFISFYSLPPPSPLCQSLPLQPRRCRSVNAKERSAISRSSNWSRKSRGRSKRQVFPITWPVHCLSICLSICLCLSAAKGQRPSNYSSCCSWIFCLIYALSTSTTVLPPIFLNILNLSIYQSICLSVCLSICLSIYLSIHQSIWQYFFLSIYQSTSSIR